MSSKDARARRKAFRRGLWAEYFACAFLMMKGFYPLGRRVRTHKGEIDLICKRGRMIIFVEVKSRMSLDAAREVMTPMARERLFKAAQAFLATRPETNHLITRLDVICVGRGLRLSHIENV